jgi:hypothetical protein
MSDFREQRHELFEEAIREHLDAGSLLGRNDHIENIAARLLPIAFDIYRYIELPSDGVDGRSRSDIYLSVARQTAQNFNQSWVARTALKMVGLDSLLDVEEVYSTRVQDFTKTARLFHKQQAAYDKHYTKALDIEQEYTRCQIINAHPVCELYASLKTWNDKELMDMSKLLGEYSIGKWELVVAGPVNLLLRIGSDGFLAIWRAMNWMGSRDEPRLKDAKVVAEDLHSLLKFEQDSEYSLMNTFGKLLTGTVGWYTAKWLLEEQNKRVLVPPDSKDRFFAAFERGSYFVSRSAENAQEE